MRYLVRTAPSHSAVAMNRALNRFFNDDFFRPFASAPNWREGWNNLALDVSESEEALTFTASLPGYNPDDVDISIHDGVVTIKGEVETKEEEEDTDSKYYLRERRFGSFHRAVRLPVEVNAEEAVANFENGVLTLTLPKVEEVKPKRITVQAS